MPHLVGRVMTPPLADLLARWQNQPGRADPLTAYPMHADHLLVVSYSEDGYCYDHYGRSFVVLFGQDLQGQKLNQLPCTILPAARREILASEYDLARHLGKPLWRSYSAQFDDGSRQCWQRLVLPLNDGRLLVGAYETPPLPLVPSPNTAEGLLRLVIDRVPVVLSEEGSIDDLGLSLQAFGDTRVQVAELEILASRDPLTGVSNLRHFRHMTGLELDHCRRMGRPFALLGLDIDHFKRINDTWGHAVGDMALKAFVAACHETLRGLDVLGRCGGEEFAVALPNTGLEGAKVTADRLCKQVENLAIPLENGDILRFTVSIGVAILDPEQASHSVQSALSDLMEHADKALYQAKHAGRNRYVVAA